MIISSNDIWAIASQNQIKYGVPFPSQVYVGPEAEREARKSAAAINRQENLSGPDAKEACRLTRIVRAMIEIAEKSWE